jgi:transposase
MDAEAGVGTLIADRANGANTTRAATQAAGCAVCSPPKANRVEPAVYDQDTFAKRHVVENFWEVLKLLRRTSTRYEKLKQKLRSLCSPRHLCPTSQRSVPISSVPQKTRVFKHAQVFRNLSVLVILPR